MPLNKQVKVYALDTGNFYSEEESEMHWEINRLRIEKKELSDRFKSVEEGTGEHSALKSEIQAKTSEVNAAKDRFLAHLADKVEENVKSNGKHHVRELREDTIRERNVIAVFDSYFTRTIGAKQDELCEDFMVVTKYYDDVMKDLIYFGFTFKGERYVYFTSSAGQIRTKKCVFVKESTWLKHQKSIMCGLTVEEINAKGGNNPNKHLAYLALANSATDVWEKFDIDKTIVVEDFGTDVYGTFDFIDDATYTVERKTDYAYIEHTDGAGMMLPNAFGENQRNMMVRLPWVKGLLGVFDYVKFIEEHGCSPMIKDIYGVEHDVIKEGIQVIFTKSQFKMNKYYDSWEHYRSLYKEHGCTAGVTNVEETRIKNATINYQMLQSLTDITDDEVKEIAAKSVEKIDRLCSPSEGDDKFANIKVAFGITGYNNNLTKFQEAINIYPNLLNDKYAKEHIKRIRNSMIKKFKSGKLNVNGKYTFVLPDLYAACEHWFMGVENPDGLLNDGEVYCRLFEKNLELDCLRSPHLYKEHPIRKNLAYRNHDKKSEEYVRRIKAKEWFDTNAIYTSCKDLISRILQFDVDGDKLLVVSDEKIIEVAHRNMKGIVPLYYNMRKAESTPLTNESIYSGLNAAFTGGNIGIYSNNISKIWNSDVFVNGTDEEKREAVKIVKLLCMENNYVIDYAKTLYKPERPDEINGKIAAFTNEKLPHFFKYAKDKGDGQVVTPNGSFVNKLNSMIENERMSFKELEIGKLDYTKMMKNPKIKFDENDPLIVRYNDFNREYYFSIDAALCSEDEYQSADRFAKKIHKHKDMANKIKYELSQFGYTDEEVSDILVKYLYGTKNARNKTVLWMCYGDCIVKNLKKTCPQPKKLIQCVDCGEWIEIDMFDSATERCRDCYNEYRKNYYKEKKREQRLKNVHRP